MTLLRQGSGRLGWAEAYAIATRRVLRAWLEDRRKGKLEPAKGFTPETWLVDLAARHFGEIREMARELMHPKPAAVCATCGAAANTVIAGKPYCPPHTQAARDQVAPYAQRGAA